MTGRTGHVWPPPEGGQTSRSDTTQTRLQLRSRYPNLLMKRVNQSPSCDSIPKTGGTIVLPSRHRRDDGRPSRQQILPAHGRIHRALAHARPTAVRPIVDRQPAPVGGESDHLSWLLGKSAVVILILTATARAVRARAVLGAHRFSWRRRVGESFSTDTSRPPLPRVQ